MGYAISSWCATCGKAKSYTTTIDTIDMRDPSKVENDQPAMCTCNNTVELRPAYTAPNASTIMLNYDYAPTSGDVIYKARIMQMQEIEQMIRRVVSEEVGRFFGGKKEAVEE